MEQFVCPARAVAAKSKINKHEQYFIVIIDILSARRYSRRARAYLVRKEHMRSRHGAQFVRIEINGGWFLV